MLARRFAQSAIDEPPYDPTRVPAAKKSLDASLVLHVTDRERWLNALGELVQLCIEAVRRKAQKASDASKPLSLDYMTDRLDIDDPMFGYMIVSKDESWLQGFVTCTTFTTWHRHFQWNSTHPCLTMLDDDADADRRVDDGELAARMQRELHVGDPDSEGIVWPRVAELSLLGALGCGAWLVQLIIDGLEAPNSPYNFLVTQATDNSVPFYERMGFTRVGAITSAKPPKPARQSSGGDKDKKKPKRTGGGSDAASGSGDADGVTPAAAGGEPPPAGGAAEAPKAKKRKKERLGEQISRHIVHTTDSGESCRTVSEKYGVDVFDILLLNQRISGLTADAWLKKGTPLRVPVPLSLEEVRNAHERERTRWHTVPDESTLKKESQRTGVDAATLLALNKNRPELKGLSFSAILLPGTKLMLRPAVDVEYEEYCHWTFPDDDNTNSCPSYMMCRPLKPRDQRGPASPDSVLEKTSSLLAHERPPIQPSVGRAQLAEAASNAPVIPLFNRVVTIDGETDYEYWYVLTYLPDLQWCHVAPLRRMGTFGDRDAASDKGNRPPASSLGRPRWMLLPEENGGEKDVGSRRCRVQRAIEVKRTKANADEEEWDILGPEPLPEPAAAPASEAADEEAPAPAGAPAEELSSAASAPPTDEPVGPVHEPSELLAPDAATVVGS